MNKEQLKTKEVKSECCNADFYCVGGGYDGEDIVPIEDICKKCGNKCKLIGGKKNFEVPF